MEPNTIPLKAPVISTAPAPAPSVTNTQPSPKPTASTTGLMTPAQIQAGITAATAEFQRIKALADQKLATQSSSASSVVSSSSPVVQTENKIKSDVGRLTATPVDENGLRANNSIALLDSQYQMLEQRRVNEVNAINASFDATKAGTEKQQANEKGSTSASLARIGGYLGGTASGTGAMLNLVAAHRGELLALEAKRQAAINEANNAITDKQFSIARLKAEEAKQIEKDIQVRKDKFFEQTMDINREQRQQDEFLSKKYQNELENLFTLDSKNIPPEKFKEIDDFYGIPGFSKNAVEINRSASQAKSQKEVLDVQQKLLNLLKDIPAGQKITFPDGTEYTGIGSSSDISTFQETDASGFVRMFTYNKANGSMTSQNLGAVGKPSTDSIDTNNPRVTQASNALGELVNPDTGYVPVNAYIEFFREYVKLNNGKGQEFLQNFDPLVWTGRQKDFLVNTISQTGGEDGTE